MNKFITTKEIRPYKIEIYGLQDNFIGTLQSYNDDFIGQVIEPEVNLSKDGTSTFKCSIPKYYIDPKTNNRVLNPRWEDVISGVLVENVRILKAYMIINNHTRVFPFIIDNIIDKRDAHYSVYKEISASGLAFAELGKVGYKLELNQNTVERDFEKDEAVVPTIQYWLDKVFPNVKNEDGAITEWLTPWCYEIRMNWSSYWAGSDGKYDNTKIYEEPYIDSWKEQDGSINPSGFVYGEEKARYLDVSGSNKYNITQDIAKTFEVFCYYEYTTDDKGQFIKTYVDENNKRWTGRKVIFYNNAINMSDPFYVDYQKNLNSINKQIESSEVYTKMYVQPQESELMTNGYITIADTPSNPLLDDFILNFDYLKQTNNLTEYQLDFINQYKIFFREKNLDLIALTPIINTMAAEVNNVKSDISLVEKEVSSAQEEQQHYKTLADNETTNVEIVKDENNSYSVIFVPQDDEYKWYRAEVRLEGADASSIKGYEQHDYKKSIFDSVIPRTKVEFNIDNQNLLLDSNKKIITKNSYFMTSYTPVSPLKPGETYTASISITAPADLDKIGLFVSSGDTALAHISTEEGQQIITGTFTMPNYIAGKTPEEDAAHAKVQLYRYPNDLLSNEITINWIKIEKGNVATPWEPALKEGPCYALLDTYGFATALYTMNKDIGENGVTYLKLRYSPVNKYNAIVSHLDGIISNGNDRVNELKTILASKEDELRSLTEQYNSIIRQKDELDRKLEKVLGPALREGYWTPETYEDVQDTKIKDINTSSSEWVWDSNAFEGEEEGYYLDGINDQGEAAKVYKQYILCDDLFGLNNLEALKNSGELQLVLQRDYSSESVSREYNQGNYFIQHNGVKYYFSLEKDYPKEVNAYFILTAKGSTIALYLIDTNTPKTEIPLSTKILEDAANLSGIFEGNNTTLQNYVLYNNSGFTYAFAQIEGVIVPIVILQKKPDELQYYTRIGYSFSNTSEITESAELVSLIKTLSADSLVYPRIQFVEKNVNYDSNLNKLTVYFSNEYNEAAADNIILQKYYDYSILVRDGTPYLTLKFSKNNSLYNFLYGKNHLIYKISRANEWLYLDALQVAKENAFPKVSYELSVGNIPEKINDVEIGQLVYISDFTLGIHAANGYISDITYKLHSPKDDEIKIQNYKTKFEDLFSSISATNEAMKTSQNTYKVIASGFEPSGLLSTETLQNSINGGDLYFNYSNTGVEINPTRGIVLTNMKPYLNGVYGQVALQGGGIYLSNSVNPETGERIWNTSITPMGINASLITAGQLNTNLIRIYADDQMAFQWNGEGIFAYGTKEGKTNIDEYVRYSKDGLHYTKRFSPESEPINLVSLDWDGFALKNNQGDDTLKVDRETGDLTIRGSMQSFNYYPGSLGSGWKIDQQGRAEFNDVAVRGTISASVFEYDETTAVGGRMYISPTLIILPDTDKPLKIEKTAEAATYGIKFYMKTPFSGETNICGRSWKEGDLVGINGVIVNRENTELRYELKNLRATITSSNAEDYLVLTTENTVLDDNSDIFYKEDGTTIDIGDIQNLFANNQYIYQESINLIFLGQKGNDGKLTQEGILLDSMGSSGPYIDIYGPEANKDSSVEENNETFLGPRVRLGDLTELATMDGISQLYPEMSGYGLYADNVYLKGKIHATGGTIGSLTIDEFEEIISQVDGNAKKITVDLSSSSGFMYAPSLSGKLKLTTLVLQGGILIDTVPEGITELKYNYQYLDADETGWHTFSQGLQDWKAKNDYILKEDPVEGRKYRAYIQYKIKNDTETKVVYSPEYTYTFVSDGESGDSDQDTASYKIITSVTSIVRDLITKITPKKIEFSLQKTIDEQTEVLALNDEYGIIVRHDNGQGKEASLVLSNSNETATLDLASYIDGEDNGSVKTLYVQAYRKNGNIQNIIDLITVPFTVGNSLMELAKVEGDQVIINDDKVYANAIVSNAIITRHISTDAIVADHISADAVTADKIAANAITAEHISTGAIETKHISGDAKNGLILSAISSINIHSNNLLRDSKGPFVLNAGTNNEYYKEYSITSTSGEEYVFSADITVNQGTVNKITVELYYTRSNNRDTYTTHTRDLPSGKRFIFPFTDKSADYNATLVAFRIYAGKKGETDGKVIILKKVQLEKGNVATGWSPHPDDPASALETSYISIQTDKIDIASGGKINLASGGAINLASGGAISLASGSTITMDSKNFAVDKDGNVSLTGTVTAKSGKIGNWNIGANGALTNTNATIGADGSLNINNKFKVSADGILEATGANISGTITATEGTIGNWSISSGALTSGATTLESSGGINVNNNFIVDSSGNVTLSSVTLQNENGGTTRANLGDYPLWKTWHHTIKSWTVAGDSVTIVTTGGDINFNKATVASIKGSYVSDSGNYVLRAYDANGKQVGTASLLVPLEAIQGIVDQIPNFPATLHFNNDKHAALELSTGYGNKFTSLVDVTTILKSVTASSYDLAYVSGAQYTPTVTLSNGNTKTFGNFTATEAFNAGADHIWTGIKLTQGSWSENEITVTATDPNDRTKPITIDATSRYNAGVNSVTVDSVTGDCGSSGWSVSATAVASNEASKTESINAYPIYERGFNAGKTAGYNSGYDAGEASVTITSLDLSLSGNEVYAKATASNSETKDTTYNVYSRYRAGWNDALDNCTQIDILRNPVAITAYDKNGNLIGTAYTGWTAKAYILARKI